MLKEHNVVLKNPTKVELRVASCYPNLYSAASSSLGFQIIYEIINSRENTWCERVVYPYTNSLESNTPLKSFDIISFSIQYEQDYFNIIKMLDKSGINPLKKNRTCDDPFIIAGGPCVTSNPRPIEKFIDLFVIGEADNILNIILDRFIELNNPHEELESFLDIPGVYIPNHLAKRVIVENLDDACHPLYQIVSESDNPEFKPAFGSTFLLGISRGCSRGCRFCMAGYMYRPRREVSLKKLFNIVSEGCELSSLNRVSLISASASDYSNIDELCYWLLNNNYSITVPSLRIESISEDTIDALVRSGLKTITLAPESNFCLRNALNKDILDSQIFDVVENALSRNLNVKLYFLTGIPGETRNDQIDMVNLIKNLNKLGLNEKKISFSVNPLIPKPHTPLQWEKYDLKSMKSNIRFLRKELKNLNIKFNSPRMGLIQYVLSNSGTEISDFILKSAREKIPLTEWKSFSYAKSLDDELPWHNIDVGIKEKFLKKEYSRFKSNTPISWCEENVCYNCGSCNS